MSRYQFIEQVAAIEPMQVLCRVLQISTAGYYQWLGRAARPTPNWEPADTASSRHAQRYGTRRLHAERQPYTLRLATSLWLARTQYSSAAPAYYRG